jgi:hypothetical protein
MGPVTIGVDIGQRVDPTAIAVLETVSRRRGKGTVTYHVARHLERLPLGTPYPAIAHRVAEVVRGVRARAVKPVSQQSSSGPRVLALDPTTGVMRVRRPATPAVTVRLYADATGVGQPVIDLLRVAGVRPVPVYFTHGDRRIPHDDGVITLGKAWLVSRLQSILQTGRLLLPETPEARVLAQELLDYEIRVDRDANDHYGAFRVGTHDDLVTALGLATQDDGPRPFHAAAGGSRPGFASLADQMRRDHARYPSPAELEYFRRRARDW